MTESEKNKACETFMVHKARLTLLDENLELIKDFQNKLEIKLISTREKCMTIEFINDSSSFFTVKVAGLNEVFQCSSKSVLLRDPNGSVKVSFDNQTDADGFLDQLYKALNTKRPVKQSVFSLRTEKTSANRYFQLYSSLSQQQNMLLDYVRTSTYQKAMLQNTVDFTGKVVVDVGAGTGILSFFAVQAGARKVYAIEASSMAVNCQRLVEANNMSDKVTVVVGKVEEVDIPEKVDMIISEPMGYLLYNERMLESYVHARKWLKPNGKMFPSKGVLYCAPFSDEMLFMEQYKKASFWNQEHFHGVDISILSDAALEEYFKQPIKTTFDTRILVAKPASHTVNFLKDSEASLHVVTFPILFKVLSTGCIHGIAFWFDVLFDGSQQGVWLSTAPSEQLTHWYQVCCLFRNPLFCCVGQEMTGTVHMVANERQSYDVDISLELTGTNLKSVNKYDLKNTYFKQSSLPETPPGTHYTNPTERYMESLIKNELTAPVPLRMGQTQFGPGHACS